MRIIITIVILLLPLISNTAWAANECAQPSSVFHIENLACTDSSAGKTIYNRYVGRYRSDIYSNDETNEWYRGDFYGLDND
jgi:hypothetical protein